MGMHAQKAVEPRKREKPRQRTPKPTISKTTLCRHDFATDEELDEISHKMTQNTLHKENTCIHIDW